MGKKECQKEVQKEVQKEHRRRSRSSSESSNDSCDEEHLKKLYVDMRKKLIKDKSLQVNGSDSYGSFYSLDSQQINPGETLIFQYAQNNRNIDLGINGQNIYVRRDGLFYIVLHVTPVGACQWTLYVNNIPQYDTVFGSYNSSGQVTITYLVPLRKDDVVTFRNYVSETAVVSISQIVGGNDPGANVEVVFNKIAPYPEKFCEYKPEHKKEDCDSDSSSSSSSDKKEHKLKKKFNILKKWMKYDPSLMINGCDAYGSFYCTSEQDVAIEAPVLFSNSQNVLNMTHVLGTGEIKVQKAGVYLFVFVVSTNQACQFTIFVNGVPDTTTTAGINKGANVLQLRQEIELKVGDIVTVVNHTSATGNVKITSNVGGLLPGINAQLLLTKISVPSALIENLEPEEPCVLEKDCMYRKFRHFLLEDCKLTLQGSSAYYYTSATALQTLNLEDPVILNLRGQYKNTYFKTGTTTVTVLESGMYEVCFDLQGKQPSQFTIYVNNVPIDSTIAGTDSGSGQVSIRQLLELNKDDVLSVKNHSSFLNPVITTVNPGGYLSGLNVVFMGMKLAPLPKKCLPK